MILSSFLAGHMALSVECASLKVLLSVVNEKVVPTLTDKQKKISVVALALFASLALFCAYRRCFFKAEQLQDQAANPKNQKDAPADQDLKASGLKDQKVEMSNEKEVVQVLEQTTMTLPNGDVATGIFVDGKLEGPGKIACLEGEIQEGLFKEGRMVEGVRTYARGGLEKGSFNEDNQLHGSGKKVLQDGSIEEGLFQNGKLEGQGKKRMPDGALAEIGIFKNGRLMQGKRIFDDGTFHEGEFKGKLIKGTMFSQEGVAVNHIG